MVLHYALRSAARLLPSAAARLAGVPGSGLPLSAEEAEQVALELGPIIIVVAAYGPNAILDDDPLRLALLRLVAFAVRCGQQHGPYSRVAESALVACGPLLDPMAPTAARARTQLDSARKLLRMHTLQSCSRAFSAAVAAVEAGPGGGGAEAGAALAAAGPQAQPTVRVRLCGKACWLLNWLLMLSTWDARAEGTGFTARQLQQFSKQQQLYARELATALRNSCVLEHAARWALHVQLAKAAGRVLDGTMTESLPCILVTLDQTYDLMDLLPDGVVAPALLREALSGPCVRHLALSLGLAVLCAADGGPSHGLPPALLLRLPILGKDAEDLRGGHGRQEVDTRVLLVMLQVLGDSTAAAATPPRGWRAVEGLLRRIGSFVLASARAWAGGGPAWSAGPQPPPLQLVLPAFATLGVAVQVLHRWHVLNSDRQAAAGAAPAAVAEAAAAWWRLAVDVATLCMGGAFAKEVRELAQHLRFQWPHVSGLLPAAPPLGLSAALAGGLLPLWERLLRRAGRNEECGEAALLTCMVSEAEANPVGLWDLLAYGDLRQGAALVATWGKLLRTLAVPRLLWSVGREAADSLTEHTALACGLAACALQMLDVAIDRLAASVRQGAVEASAPQLQLTRLFSCAAYHWLPPLARLVREGLPAVQRVALISPPSTDIMQNILARAHALAAWLRVLARRSGSGLGQAATESASATAPTATTVKAGWRQLLLQEVGAVALLGAMCHHVGWGKQVASRSPASKNQLPIGLPLLLSSCCRVAAACPAEVRQAVVAAAAGAAAAGAISGAGQGSGSDGGRQRGGQGTTGRVGGAGVSHSAVATPPGWSPQLLRLLAAELGSRPGNERMVATVFALVRQAEQWVADSSEDCAELAAAVAALSPEPDVDAAARALLPSPAEARALLRTCANPACDNLAGDSEAGLPRRACGRCGGVWYCRQVCQAAHWRSGHKEACAGLSVAGAGAVGSGPAAVESSAR